MKRRLKMRLSLLCVSFSS